MRRPSRAALTLIEMLVAMAVTLIMMGAVVSIFGLVGDSISTSRAGIEISERLRNARNRLQDDLQGVTAQMIPPLKPENDLGYFEYIEGPFRDGRDFTTTAPGLTGAGLFGDTDDILCFTTQSKGEPFVGKGDPTVSSPLAEVIWYLLPNTTGATVGNASVVGPNGVAHPLFTLYRRVLVISPGADAHLTDAYIDFIHEHDISARPNGSGVALNNLGDLTKRENRFMHNPLGTATFPFAMTSPPTPSGNVIPLGDDRLGEDVILTNVLAFDVQAFDPGAPITVTSGIAVEPSDPGSTPASPTTYGGYADLGYTYNPTVVSPTPPNPHFNNLAFNNPISSGLTVPTYDTWSASAFNPQATDGLDNNSNGIVDESAENTAPPPYPSPLRGIQIKIRVYEPDSKQVREVTIVQDFLSQ